MLDPVEVIVRGRPNTGKTSLARFIEEELRKIGYRSVRVVSDTPPMANKPEFAERLRRNMAERPVHIRVELLP
jgi:tRNA uridine 5-carbamoylmethylation protein Kti12